MRFPIAASPFRLNADQRRSIEKCLERALVRLREPARIFFERIEGSIDLYLCTKPNEPISDARDALKALWKRCRLEPSPVRVLRVELRKLPQTAIEHISRRARGAIPKLFPNDRFEDRVSDPPDRLASRFLAWAESADD